MNKENKFADRLLELRKEKGISQEKLGEALDGYKKTSISEWELGKKEPSFDVLLKVAEYFNVSTDYLLGRVDF